MEHTYRRSETNETTRINDLRLFAKELYTMDKRFDVLLVSN